MIDYREDNKWTVYVHTNKINGKMYVGITSKKPEKRWGEDGKKYEDSKYFWNAIQKYGFDNFEHEIIAQHLTQDEAFKMEKDLIRELKTQDRNLGYNISAGGQGPNGIHLTKDQAERAAASKRKSICQFDLDMNFIKEYKSCTEAAEAMGTSTTNISGAANGRTLTAKGSIWIYSDRLSSINKEEILARIESARKPIPVCQFTLTMDYIKTFKSLHSASRECDIPEPNILTCATNKTNTAGGYIWIYEKDYLRMKNREIPMRKPFKSTSKSKPIYKSIFKPICQFTRDMEFIAEYSNIAEASRITGANDGEISRCALGKARTAKDFIWIYKKDYEKMLSGELPMHESVKSNKRPVVQLTLDMKYIQEYESAKEAKRITGINDSSIRSVCNGYSKSAKGYIWMYKDDYEQTQKEAIA